MINQEGRHFITGRPGKVTIFPGISKTGLNIACNEDSIDAIRGFTDPLKKSVKWQGNLLLSEN